MPKKIPNLAETILDQAAQLFSRLGYDAVDMKLVAAEAGTSVGNLYNYYPSKPALFIAIVDRWKTRVVEACMEILNSQLPRRERILAVLHRLYDDVSAWHGLWKEFLGGREERRQMLEAKAKNAAGHPWGLGERELILVGQLETLLTGQSSTSPHRWAYLIITATLQLAGRYPEAREENWKFIETLVDKV